MKEIQRRCECRHTWVNFGSLWPPRIDSEIPSVVMNYIYLRNKSDTCAISKFQRAMSVDTGLATLVF